ncbi:MAG: PLDc_N domain-containing protein [Flavobacteriaceae bacterium]|nr:PLDc_N domain-containing protein [Flavobacteriaceae bacterium]
METTISDISYSLYIWQAFIFLTIGLLLFCLIDILRNKFEQNDKMVWVLVVILLPILGSLLYLTIGMRKKIKVS